MPASGTILCLGSGAAFGSMAVFGKLAYAGGATVGTLLSLRFALAAALLWAALPASGRARLRALAPREVAIALALGACGYALQSGGYFAALDRIDASLVALLVYCFPAMVAVSATALGRERLDGGRAVALVLASAGLVLVLAGAGAGTLDPLGATLALATALVYSVYVLAGESISRRVGPHLLSALVCSGAAASLTVAAALLGELRPGALSASGWIWLACLAAVSTVAAIGLFFAGMRRVGPTNTSILATVEPLVTVALAFAVFGEQLGPLQLAGGALVLAAGVTIAGRKEHR